ncbi:ROK family transcriptional regulator [Demequina sp. SYSU T00192]|uniref:ROK family transcriptional regulator n=1 Tax=Demequina litoralis TaxID=3051660 RepID=A0ABT8GAC7_9MICO|nr:ROK family transcriptional regulator [Demequina sp. SYSU T00192]MDN4476086.1 ROK family transcriptional regulator [Demequina sp. SYSU T00192]
MLALSTDASTVLAILRDGIPRTKSQLAEAAECSRSTVSAHLAHLVEIDLVSQLDETLTTKGRPSTLYALHATSRVILAADIGMRHATVAVTDLAGRVMSHRLLAVEVEQGPDIVLEAVLREGHAQLDGHHLDASRIAGVGVGLPGAVDHASDRPILPLAIPGWDGYDLVGRIRAEIDAPVLVENDVNVMAIGEGILTWPHEREVLMVKVATGIGAGVITHQRVVRGSEGVAGDIGHIRVEAAGDRMCTCGQTGCLGTVASGLGIAETLRQQGLDTDDGRQIVALVRSGSTAATSAVRQAGRAIGEALAACIAVLNPSVIVIGGSLAAVGEPLLAGIREVVYQRAQPLASRHLRIVPAHDIELAGIAGLSRLVQGVVFRLV